MEKPRKNRVWTPRSAGRYTQQRINKAASWNRRSLRLFAEWLESCRGLSASSITVRLGSASTFVDATTKRAGCSCAKAFRRLTVNEIEEFFVVYGKSSGPAARRSMQAAMRLFLQYASFRGWVDSSLALAVPSLKTYRLSGLPRAISEEHLAILLESPSWSSGQCRKRDRAIVYLLATYGIRRSQISALKLSDITWQEKRILFRGSKGGKSVDHVLTNATAQALARYLHSERPNGEQGYVFLRSYRPYLRLNPATVSSMVHARMVLCGLPPRYPHAFRHAFASRMLRANQPSKTIADLLGHRSLSSVSIYAKLDHARLLDVAIEWPESTS